MSAFHCALWQSVGVLESSARPRGLLSCASREPVPESLSIISYIDRSLVLVCLSLRIVGQVAGYNHTLASTHTLLDTPFPPSCIHLLQPIPLAPLAAASAVGAPRLTSHDGTPPSVPEPPQVRVAGSWSSTHSVSHYRAGFAHHTECHGSNPGRLDKYDRHSAERRHRRNCYLLAEPTNAFLQSLYCTRTLGM